MQYVFISHANRDKTQNREHLRAIVDALTQSGVTVWIDNPVNLGYSPDEAGFLRIHAGRPYQDEIDEAHEGADAVLAVWSANVVARFPSGAPHEGHVLRDEIVKAREQGKLICCCIDGTDPTTYPPPFDKEEIPDVRSSQALNGLVDDVLGKQRPPFFRNFREDRIKEWSAPGCGANDQLFTKLALLLDRGSEHDERWEPQKKDYETLKAVLDEEQNQKYPAFVLLGSPGSGKSTLLRHFDLQEARHAREQDPTGELASPFSYFVSLRDYENEDRSSPDAPLDWLNERWDRHWRKGNLQIQPLEELLQRPDSYLLLDALNEMPRGGKKHEKSYEDLVADWKAFIAEVRDRDWKCRIIISCRSLLYSSSLSAAGEEMVPHIRIERLDPPTIEKFLDHYAGDKATELYARIEDQLDLYQTAYFLRMLVDVFKRTGQVPRDRAALLTAFMRMLLAREYNNDNQTIRQPGPLSKDDVSRLDGGLARSNDGWRTPYELLERGPLFRQLGKLALSMQNKGGKITTGERLQLKLDHEVALEELAPELGVEEDARVILRAACELSILEHNRSASTVEFAHQLIQEFFAGRRLAETFDARLVRVGWRNSDVDELVPVNTSDPLPPADTTGWEESTLFAVQMAEDRERFIRDLMEANLPLAGRAAAEVRVADFQSRDSGEPTGRQPLTDVLMEELRDKLRSRMNDCRGVLRARISAGKALGDLGDSRFTERPCTGGFKVLTPPLLRVDQGTYRIGQNDSQHRFEKPRHSVHLKAFNISQFPVTNAEWKRFMQDGGYEDEQWWQTKASKLWWSGETTHAARTVQWYAFRFMLLENRDYIDSKLEIRDISEKIAEDQRKARDKTHDEFAASVKTDFAGGRHVEPRRWRDQNFDNPLQPVVGISWYEASAYCAWLSARTGESWRLPTEAEWEAAARLGRSGRAIYPWGCDFDQTRCNTFRSHVRATTPVGLYLDAPEGRLAVLAKLFRKKPSLELADISGNAFEWTSSCYDKDRFRYPYRPDDGRENAEDEPGRDDEASKAMVKELRKRAQDENWNEARLNQSIEVARYFPRVLRGGSFYYWPDEARMSFRLRFHPGYHNQSTGFRLVREV